MRNDAYRLIETKELPECGGTGYLYEHSCGARVVTLKTEDPNKVFMIGFRTVPSDSTGVAHILEHSVLCGSEKYPLKDPFVELAKGSLNTFLNAMTYPDRTVYPVASCNEKDFMNLMDVYMDAVLHPDIYREKKIFLQEGWHCEAGEDGELLLNGVVYNEMKGVYSSPDSVLERYTLNSLYPHTTYGFESGGDPEDIPKLSYEQFLDFHRKYYHPSNSYIWLYGDMDMEEKLAWLDERYLSAYTKEETDSEITEEPAFAAPVYVEKPYAVTESDETENRSYLSENFVIRNTPDSLTDLAWEAIDFVLLSAPGAPLKEELLEKGFGEEIYGGYSGGIRQPYFSVIARNTEKEKLPGFRKAVKEILSRIVREGFDKKSLEAALNYLEFKYREEDYGRTPAGLEYGLTALESWIYDRGPWMYLTYSEEFKKLKSLVGTGFYEKLLGDACLSNPHSSQVVVVPEKGLTEKKDLEKKKELKKYAESLSEDEFRRIAREGEELKEWQETEDSAEAKKCLPTLELSDLTRQAEKVLVKEKDGVIYSELETHGIAYLRLIFDLSSLSQEELLTAAFLKDLYGELNTKEHSFKENSDRILLKTGGVDYSIGVSALDTLPGKQQPFLPLFTAEIRALKEGIGEGIRLAFEMKEETLFDDTDRIAEKLSEARSAMQSTLDGASHVVAMTRAMAYQESISALNDLYGGVAWYDWLCAKAKAIRNPEELKKFARELEAVSRKLAACPFEVALAGNDELLEETNRVLKFMPEKNRRMPGREKFVPYGRIRPLGQLNEGMKTGSMVNYVARAGRYLTDGEKYDGAVEVLKVMLNFEYLWTNLRVKGGAYGCMCGFTRSGKGYFVSYRDPNLGDTNRIYEELPAWLEAAEISEENVLKYIIGAIASSDQPVTASVRASRQLSYYFSGMTSGDLQSARNDILGCTADRLRAFAPLLARLFGDNNICVVGGSEKIRSEAGLFKNVRDLK